MPPYCVTVPPSSTVGGKSIWMGLMCTLPSLPLADNGSVADFHSETNLGEKKKQKPFYIHDEKALDKVLEKEPGKIYVLMKTGGEEASKIRDMAIKSDPITATKIGVLEAQGISYAIEVRRKTDLIKGRGGGALDVWDVTGLDKGNSVYRKALKNEAILRSIEAVCPKQVAAVKTILTTVGDVAGVAPESPAKTAAVQFKFFLEEISEVLSSLKKTNAPKELLLCAVPAVFAKYKSEYWDGVMTLAGKEAGKELQACADEILDPQHINNYLEFIEKARWAPPGPSCEAFDVAFGLLSEVDTGTTSAFRDLIVYLHDTVKSRVDSLDKVRALRVNQEGLRDEEIKFQINQLDICTRNYLQCFHSIGQKLARIKDIKDMSVPDKKAQLQAVMRERISEVHWKFWPALKTSLDKLCDPSVVKDIESKVQTLTEQLSDAESATVKDSSYMSRLWSLAKSFMGADDGVKGQDINGKDDDKALSPMFFDLLKIVEQLETYGQVASSSPEESPHLPDTIEPGDRVAICGALGFVSKPKAAALFTILNRLQALLESFPFRATASPEELASIEKFLNVDYHIVEAMEKEGHSFGVHGGLNVEECNKIMTSTFERYFKDCWSHVAAVLEGGDQEEAAKVFEGMATGILKWKDREQELDWGRSRIIEMIKKVGDINTAWYLAGMFQFVQGAVKEEDWHWWRYVRKDWKWYRYTQDMWSQAFCLKLQPYENDIAYVRSTQGNAIVCLPAPTWPSNTLQGLDMAAEQSINAGDNFHGIHSNCFDGFFSQFFHDVFGEGGGVDKLDYSPSGDLLWTMRLFREDNLWKHVEGMGINPSCRHQFTAQWYDASNQVIRYLCNEALAANLIKAKKSKGYSWNSFLIDEYEFKLVTGFHGLNFRSDHSKSNYQGFVMCLDTSTPSDKEFMRRFANPKYSAESNREKIMAQRRCRWRTHRGKEREVSLFYSMAKVEKDGKIFIDNPHHRGYIASCWPRLLKEIESVKKVKPRLPRDVGNVTRRAGPISQKEIVEAFAAAEEEGLIKVDQFYGNFVGEGNHSTNWIPASLDINNITDTFDFGEPIEGCATKLCELDKILSYWPYVVGVMGTAFAARKVWDCLRRRSEKPYDRVTGEEAGVVV